jgi:glucosamine--fructose-6-phosphate aminotransferase (isomerizing)
LEKEDDDLVVPECREDLSLLLKVMVVQYLAYYLALEKGLNPDEPRNLSKAVTI